MISDDYLFFKGWFDAYADQFYRQDPEYDFPIRLKVEHTRRVCGFMAGLGRALSLSGNDLLLARALGLFHDIGRFPQYARYGTFNDRKSRNHARLGLNVLCTRKVLARLPQAERRMIAVAIAWHNAAGIPSTLDSRTGFFARLLRDADKLDIWQVFIHYYQGTSSNPAIVHELPDTPEYSPAVVRDIMAGRFARLKDLKSVNDFKLLQLSWVFDINFTPTFRIIQKRRYIEKIAATLPQTPVVRHAIDKVLSEVSFQVAGPVSPIQNTA